jgi:putative transposase
MEHEREQRVEPYRVCRRLNILRDYPDEKIKIYP